MIQRYLGMCAPGPRLQRGGAVIEYSIVTFLAVLVLVGIGAEEDVVAQLIEAIHKVYDAFTHALSLTFPAPV